MAEVIERVAKLEEQYGAIMQRFDRVDGDIARVEGRLETGLADVNRRLDAGLVEVRQSIVRLDDKLDSGFKWLMGGIAGGFLTVVVLIIGQILFGR